MNYLYNSHKVNKLNHNSQFKQGFKNWINIFFSFLSVALSVKSV